MIDREEMLKKYKYALYNFVLCCKNSTEFFDVLVSTEKTRNLNDALVPRACTIFFHILL